MKKLKFHCTNCEVDRNILVKHVDVFYIIGICEVCKMKITINRAKARVSV